MWDMKDLNLREFKRDRHVRERVWERGCEKEGVRERVCERGCVREGVRDRVWERRCETEGVSERGFEREMEFKRKTEVRERECVR